MCVLSQELVQEEMKLESTEKDAPLLSESQRKAHWLFCQQVADALRERGVTMRDIAEALPTFEIPPTKDNVHNLWLWFQENMFGTTSTKQLTKNEGQINDIHRAMMNVLGEKFEIDYIDFPSTCRHCKHIDCLCGKKNL